jgi:photosystem II stability/assembly factor-like uncharacterized protein
MVRAQEAPAKDPELFNLVLARSEALKNSSVTLESAGGSRGKFVSADKNTLTIEIDGQQQPLPWKLVSAKDVFSLACLAANSADELLLVAKHAKANGQDALAEKFIDKAVQKDPSRLAEVQGMESAAKAAKPQNVSAPTPIVSSSPSYPAVPVGPWQVVGPGGGGTIYTPMISPFDPKVAIVTCDMSAVYMTRDGGRHWRVLPHLRYGHGIAYGWDPNTVFVGCSDRLYKSVDAGNTWQGIGGERKHPTCACYDVLVDPDDGRTVWVAYGVAGEAGNQVSDSNRFLIERSFDAGATFKDCSQGLPQGSGMVKKLALDRNTSPGSRTLYAATTKGFFRSKDGGTTWESAGKGLPKSDLRNCVALYDKGAHKTAVLVSTEPDGVYRSEDGGATFSPSGKGLSDKDDGGGFVCEQLAAGWDDPNLVYAAGTHVARSTDGGRTWSKIYADANKQAGWLMVFYPWAHDGWRACGCNPKNPKQVWFSGDMQLTGSDDGGATLVEINSHPMPEGTPRFAFKEQYHKVPKDAPMFYDGGGLEVTFCYQVIPDRARDGVFYACYADVGSFRTEDGGKSWTYNEGIWNVGLKSEWRNSCYEIAVDKSKPGHLYGVFSGFHNLPHNDVSRGGKYAIGGAAESQDGGKSWTPFENAGLPDKPCTSILLDRRNGTLFVAVYGTGVYRSSNNGKSFESICAGLPKDPNAWRLRQSADNSIFLGCTLGNPGGLWKFDDAKSSWSRIDKSPQFSDVRDIRVPETGKSMIVAADGADGGVFYSEDAGGSWKKLYDKGACSADHTPDGRIWFAGSEHGLFRSGDAGATWAKVNDLPFPSGVNDVTINPKNPGEVWIGTAGAGVIRGNTQ